MKSKILLAVVAIMVAMGSLVGCNAMKEGVEEVMPTNKPSASASAGASTNKPSQTPTGAPGMGAETSPSASATATPGANNAGN